MNIKEDFLKILFSYSVEHRHKNDKSACKYVRTFNAQSCRVKGSLIQFYQHFVATINLCFKNMWRIMSLSVIKLVLWDRKVDFNFMFAMHCKGPWAHIISSYFIFIDFAPIFDWQQMRYDMVLDCHYYRNLYQHLLQWYLEGKKWATKMNNKNHRVFFFFPSISIHLNR